MADTEVQAQGRQILYRAQDSALAYSPLAIMPAWCATGVFPQSAGLRAEGYRSELPMTGLSERDAFIRHWGNSIPCAEAIDALRMLGPLLEIGAGSGYWSAILSRAGHDVIATDIGLGLGRGGFEIGAHFPVDLLAAADAIQAHPDRDVFCSWPDEPPASWAAGAVNGMRPGRTLALISDGPGGVCGADALYAVLGASFEHVATVEIPQFPEFRDDLKLYRRL